MGFQNFGNFRSRHPAIRTTGLLTFALAGLSPAEHTSVSWSPPPDMLTVRVQAIDGTGTFTLSDFQPCRLLTSLQPHYRAFITTTGCSAPALRFGTFALAVGTACDFSLSIEVQVRTFYASARLRFAPPTCRMPLGPYQDIVRADLAGRCYGGQAARRLHPSALM